MQYIEKESSGMLQRWSNRVKGDRNARAEIGRKGRRNE